MKTKILIVFALLVCSVTDNGNATAIDDVTIVAANLPAETVWNSYDIVVGSNVATYWAKGTGVADPHIGKSTVARGSDAGESNVPSPSGVFDLQMRPPNLNNLVVSAFTVPVNGSYGISNIAGRRVMSDGIDSRIKIFNNNKTLILDLELKTGQPWVQSAATLAPRLPGYCHMGIVRLITLVWKTKYL